MTAVTTRNCATGSMFVNVRSCVAALVCCAMASAAMGQVPPAELVTIAQGPMSNIEEPRQVVVRSIAEWQALWKEHDPQRAAPVVDFTQSIVVAVFLGTRPTAGFAVEITAIKTEGNRAVVEYRERRPPGDALLAQVLTAPFHIARSARTSGSIEFRRIDAP
jgi:PrcB C-terminal